MTDSRQALDELKRAATHKIRVADSVYGIIQLRNGRLVMPKRPEPDPERLEGAEHLPVATSSSISTAGRSSTNRPKAGKRPIARGLTAEEASEMEWFYARVSTVAQNEARQIDAAHEAGIPDSRIVLDKQSGKDFQRTNWQSLVAQLQSGDVLFIKSLDRLGRNYAEILDVWKELTRDRGVDVVVLDMPILDTRRDKTLIGTLIADLVLSVLSFCAENERAYILERQREGIASAKIRGVKFGRPLTAIPDNFEDVATLYSEYKLTLKDAARQTGLATSTFNSLFKRCGYKRDTDKWQRDRKKPNRSMTEELVRPVADRWFNNEISTLDATRELDLSDAAFRRWAHIVFPGREYRSAAAIRAEEIAKELEQRRQIRQARRAATAQLKANRERRKSKFFDLARNYLDTTITSRQAAVALGVTQHSFVQLVNYHLLKGHLEK